MSSTVTDPYLKTGFQVQIHTDLHTQARITGTNFPFLEKVCTGVKKKVSVRRSLVIKKILCATRAQRRSPLNRRKSLFSSYSFFKVP